MIPGGWASPPSGEASTCKGWASPPSCEASTCGGWASPPSGEASTCGGWASPPSGEASTWWVSLLCLFNVKQEIENLLDPKKSRITTAMPPNITSASCDHNLWPPDPKSWTLPCWPFVPVRIKIGWLVFQNIVFTILVTEKQTHRRKECLQTISTGRCISKSIPM